MTLRDIDEQGRTRPVDALDHFAKFQQTWDRISAEDQAAIEAEINCRIDEVLTSPSPNWGAILNTSIEGGRPNPTSGVRGDWSGTPFHAIYIACGESEEAAALFYGTVWKKIIIGRAEPWVGIRSDPTFPRRGITLLGKTYFPDRSPQG